MSTAFIQERLAKAESVIILALDDAQVGQVRMDLTTAKMNTSAQALYESQDWVQDVVFLPYNKAVFADCWLYSNLPRIYPSFKIFRKVLAKMPMKDGNSASSNH